MKSRWLIVVVALAGASLFALSVIGGAWWYIGDVASIGPFGSRRCFGETGECRATGLNWIGADARWMRIGMATWAAGMLAMLALAALAATAASKRAPKLLAKLVMSAVGTAALAGIAFVALFPKLEAASLGRGSILYFAGAALGLAAAVLLVRAANARAKASAT